MTTEQQPSPLAAMRQLSDRRKSRRSESNPSSALDPSAFQMMRGLSERRSTTSDADSAGPPSLGPLLSLAKSRSSGQRVTNPSAELGAQAESEPSDVAVLEPTPDPPPQSAKPPRRDDRSGSTAEQPQVEPAEAEVQPHEIAGESHVIDAGGPRGSAPASEVLKTEQIVVLPSPAVDEVRCDAEPLQAWPPEEPSEPEPVLPPTDREQTDDQTGDPQSSDPAAETDDGSEKASPAIVVPPQLPPTDTPAGPPSVGLPSLSATPESVNGDEGRRIGVIPMLVSLILIAAIILGIWQPDWLVPRVVDTRDLEAQPIEEPSSPTAPPTDAPSTDARSTDAASTDAASTDAPSTDAPSTDAPSTDAASTDAPSTDAASTEAASTDAASTEAASTEAPPTDAPSSPSDRPLSSSEMEPSEPAETEPTQTDVDEGLPTPPPPQLDVPPASEEMQPETDALKERSQSLLRAITASVGDEARYAGALSRYVDEFPNEERARDFRRVLETELPGVASTRVWNDYALQIAGGFATLTPERAGELRGVAEYLREQLAASQFANQLAGDLRYLEAIERRQDGQIMQQLLAAFENSSLRGRYVFCRPDKGCYYYVAPPRDRLGRTAQGMVIPLVEAQCITSFATEEHGPGLVPVKYIFFDPGAFAGNHHDRLSLCRDLDKVVDRLRRIDQGGWEATFLEAREMLETAFEKRESMNCPELAMRLYLLRKLLHAGGQGSAHLAGAFDPCLQLLDGVSLEPERSARDRLHGLWLNPENSPTNLPRECAAALDEPVHQQCVARAEQPMRNPLPRPIDWVGWLHRGDDGRWVSQLRGQSPGSPMLLIAPDSSDSQRVIELDAADDLDSIVQAERDALVWEGTPIFSLAR